MTEERATNSVQRIHEMLIQSKRSREQDDQNDQAGNEVPVVKKKKKIPRILDGTFYVVEQHQENGQIKAKCQECGDIRKGNITSTGNFKTHYKTHPEKLKDLEEYLKQDASTASATGDQNVTSFHSKQPRIDHAWAPVSQDKIASKLVDFVVEGNLAFNVAQLPSLQSLLEAVCGRKVIMPSRRRFMKELQSKFDAMKSTLKDTLKQQEFLCVTCDVWSSKGQSYLGVTVHFINQDFKRESYLLAFKRLHSKQTYLYLAQVLDEIFKDYGIDIDKITNIVTDGGAAFCKMFKEFGSPTETIIENTDHDDNETTTSSEGQQAVDVGSAAMNENDSLDTVSEFMQTETGELFQTEILEFAVEENSQPDDYFGGSASSAEEPRIKLPPQRRCFSHLLNLASQDFDKELPAAADRAFKQTYNKLNALWRTTNRSSYAKSICEKELGCVLKTPCETRWNSRFDSIKKIFDIEVGERNKINSLVRRLKSELAASSHLSLLDQNDISVMENYIKVMQPIACALDTLQGEYNCSQGFILPVLFSMKHRVEMTEGSFNILMDFKRGMLLVIQKRFGKYFEFNSEIKDLILASISVPKVRVDFIQDEADFIFAKQLLITECKNYKRQNINEPYTDSIPETDGFLVRFNSRRNSRRGSIENEIESEVAAFLMDNDNEYTMLNRYPTIRLIFFKYNTTLSSSAAVERVFSQSLIIFTARRNRISADHFEQTLLLKINKRCLSNEIKSG